MYSGIIVQVVSIRILLTAPPSPCERAVRDVLACQSDIELIEAPPTRGLELLTLLRRVEPDFLVVESDAHRVLALCDQVLNEYPHLILLAIGSDPPTITLHQLKVESRTMPSSSLMRLPDELRVLTES